jgi:uncharacterized membrane protein HdeD (DUF308 family)
MLAERVFVGLEQLRHVWGWMLALGILMIVLGVVALFTIPVATLAAVLVLGWLLVFSGVVEAVHAFRVHSWGGAILHIVAAVLGIIAGMLVVTHPVAGALVWTLVIASFLSIVGVFRIVSALWLKYVNWGWALVDGLITLTLGIMVWAAWPVSGLWFLGLALGISLLFRGWSYVMMALAVRTLVPSAISDGGARLNAA